MGGMTDGLLTAMTSMLQKRRRRSTILDMVNGRLLAARRRREQTEASPHADPTPPVKSSAFAFGAGALQLNPCRSLPISHSHIVVLVACLPSLVAMRAIPASEVLPI